MLLFKKNATTENVPICQSLQNDSSLIYSYGIREKRCIVVKNEYICIIKMAGNINYKMLLAGHTT